MPDFNNVKRQSSPYLFFVRFIVLFAILFYFFQFYWGITGLGGRIYSSFLAEHFNIINGFSHFLAKSAGLLLNVFGYDTFQRQFNTLRIGTSRGVIVNPSCLGWAVLSFWMSFIYANNGSFMHKTKWMLFGGGAIILINILRIALIALANHLKWEVITSLDHHQTFNIASYCFIFILMFSYLTFQKKYERINIEPVKEINAFKTV